MFSSVFSWASAKLQAGLALAGAILVAVAYAFLKGRARGAKDTTDTINRQTQKVEEKSHEIDARRPDFDGAVSNLRKRAAKR